MSSQIFRSAVSKNTLHSFLESCAEKKHKYYTFTKTLFKAAQFKELIEPFCKSIEDNYYVSKRYYITRKMTYKNFVTVLRQICKYHQIPFISRIKYYKSTYDISYTIFFGSEK